MKSPIRVEALRKTVTELSQYEQRQQRRRLELRMIQLEVPSYFIYFRLIQRLLPQRRLKTEIKKETAKERAIIKF
jgi:hypothetical protein